MVNTTLTSAERAIFRRRARFTRRYHGRWDKGIGLLLIWSALLAMFHAVHPSQAPVPTKFPDQVQAARTCMQHSGWWFRPSQAVDIGMGRFAIEEDHGDTAEVCKILSGGRVVTYTVVQHQPRR